MKGFFTLQLDDASLRYLSRLTSGAPIEFAPNPVLFFSDPRLPVEKEPFADRIGVREVVAFQSAKTVYNTDTSMSEYLVLLKPTQPVSEGFIPYFMWLFDPSRSSRSRNYLVSITNSLDDSQAAFSGTLVWRDETDPKRVIFNPNSQSLSDEPWLQE